MAEPEHIARGAALLGGGVVGGGWAARLVLAGVDVRLYDPAPDAEQVARTQIERARRVWRRLTTAPPAPEGRLIMAATVAEAVAGAELIQESAPEREQLKRALLAEASRAADPDAVIATSTSGLLPSRLCADMAGPERLIVGHPFNPVYLLPLVEICASDRTSPQTVARAGAIYRGLGMRPLIVRHEVGAFIANRLLEALWREALWLVADDVATVAEVDDAIRYGPGLRWSAMGTFLTYRLAGGEAGMRHFLAQFGPTLELPWTRLTDVPVLDQHLIDKVVAQSDEQAQGLSTEELVRIRDDCLVSVLLGLKSERFGAGLVIADTEERLRAAVPEREPTSRDGWLTLHEAIVAPDWVDYNGDISQVRYAQVLSDATDAVLRHIGIAASSTPAGQYYYTAETHGRHLAEANAGDRVSVASRVVDRDDNHLRLLHELRRSEDQTLLATGEHLLVHVDKNAGGGTPVETRVLAAVPQFSELQSGMTVAPTTGTMGTDARGLDITRSRTAQTSDRPARSASSIRPRPPSEADSPASKATREVASTGRQPTDPPQHTIAEDT